MIAVLVAILVFLILIFAALVVLFNTVKNVDGDAYIRFLELRNSVNSANFKLRILESNTHKLMHSHMALASQLGEIKGIVWAFRNNWDVNVDKFAKGKMSTDMISVQMGETAKSLHTGLGEIARVLQEHDARGQRLVAGVEERQKVFDEQRSEMLETVKRFVALSAVVEGCGAGLIDISEEVKNLQGHVCLNSSRLGEVLEKLAKKKKK